MMTSTKVKVRLKISIFIKQVAQVMPQPHEFSIRGDCVNSFCLLTCLPIEEYMAMLKAANPVSMKNKKLGGYIFEMSKDVWNNFLQDQVRIAETTKAKIKIQTLKIVSQGECKGPKCGRVHLICISFCDFF